MLISFSTSASLAVDMSSLLCLFMGDSTSVLPLAFVWQALGAAGLSHHTLFPLLLVVPLFLHLPVPVSCIASSTLHVSCHLCFAAVSLLGSRNHTSPNQLSVCPAWLLPHPLSLLTLLLACCPRRFYITFILQICCPS